MLCSIANSYRVEVLKALMQDADLSKDKKGILKKVILYHIKCYRENGLIYRAIIREMNDYTEYACRMEPILYPLLSDHITGYEEALTLNLAVIFGYRRVVKTLLKFDIKQEMFLMDKPYKLTDTDLYPINFAYYNGDLEIAKLLMVRCPKVMYTVNVHEGSSNILVTASMFGRETIYNDRQKKFETVRKIVETLKLPFPYLRADFASRNKVYYMLQDNSSIKHSLIGGYIPKGVTFVLDSSYETSSFI